MLPAQGIDYLLHLILPRKSNNFKAKLLHTSYLLFLTLLVVGIQFAINVSASNKIAILGYSANISPDEVIRLTNEKRAQNGLTELKYDPVLAKAAMAKGTHMLNYDYWAHVAPDGTEPWYFFNQAGYEYKYAGENLARDFSNPKDAVEAWMASPSHRENMLSDKYSDIGVAVVEGDMNGADTTIIVQLFGTRMGQTAPSIPVVSAQEKNKITKPETVLPQKTEPTQPELMNEPPTYEASQVNKNFIASPFDATKWISLILISILMIVFLLDAVVVWHKRIYRKSGRVLAHVSFFGMIIVILLIAKSGRVL
jgi:hypothetical protein